MIGVVVYLVLMAMAGWFTMGQHKRIALVLAWSLDALRTAAARERAFAFTMGSPAPKPAAEPLLRSKGDLADLLNLMANALPGSEEAMHQTTSIMRQAAQRLVEGTTADQLAMIAVADTIAESLPFYVHDIAAREKVSACVGHALVFFTDLAVRSVVAREAAVKLANEINYPQSHG